MYINMCPTQGEDYFAKQHGIYFNSLIQNCERRHRTVQNWKTGPKTEHYLFKELAK